MDKGLLQKFHNKYHTNNEILNAFPFRLKRMAEMTALTSSIQHCTVKVLTRVLGKKMK